MAYEARFRCLGEPYENVSGVGVFAVPEGAVYCTGGYCRFFTADVNCFDADTNISTPQAFSVLPTYTLGLADAASLVPAIALCWAVAWLLRRVMRALGHH
jgi:hypothetical protein